MAQEHEKKQFSYPKKEDVIEQIKTLDDDIQHVSLNLIKCNFEATEKDIEKAFPEYKFIKVKNYNPGSFQVIFEVKIDAINFVRNCFDRKILGRRFFIKMGRQHKEVLEDWACVGYVPKKFTQNKNQHKGGKGGPHHKKGQNEEGQQKQEKKAEEQPTAPESIKQQKKVQNVQAAKQQETKPQAPQKKGITIPITYEHHKNEKHQNKQNQEKKQYPPKNEGAKTEQNKKREPKKDNKKQQPQKPKETKPVEQTKAEEDDGWIQVPAKTKKR